MTAWLILPHDPLIFRDGRPFDPTPGVRAHSLAFPFPSTTTGGLRTRAGSDAAGRFDTKLIDDVLRIAVRGPLLAEVVPGQAPTLLAPAPADALFFKLDSSAKGEAMRRRLIPLPMNEGEASDLPDGLAPVGMPDPDPNKPIKELPRFWQWNEFESWLREAQDRPVTLSDIAQAGPGRDTRMHVSIDPKTGTAAEGNLFQTQGLAFVHARQPAEDQPRHENVEWRRLALLVDANVPAGLTVQAGVAPLGGEGRLVTWEQRTEMSLPSCPGEIRRAILRDRACRVVLLTPACFGAGFRPAWLLGAGSDARGELVGAVVGRPQVVSGWDYKARGPKPTRRLAPAGSVFFLRFPNDTDEATLSRWIDSVWMQNVSDDEKDRRDGFGLAALGTWDGKEKELKR